MFFPMVGKCADEEVLLFLVEFDAADGSEQHFVFRQAERDAGGLFCERAEAGCVDAVFYHFNRMFGAAFFEEGFHRFADGDPSIGTAEQIGVDLVADEAEFGAH